MSFHRNYMEWNKMECNTAETCRRSFYGFAASDPSVCHVFSCCNRTRRAAERWSPSSPSSVASACSSWAASPRALDRQRRCGRCYSDVRIVGFSRRARTKSTVDRVAGRPLTSRCVCVWRGGGKGVKDTLSPLFV